MLAIGMYAFIVIGGGGGGGHWTCWKPVADKQFKLYRDNDVLITQYFFRE